jgi:hypothetical protein
VPNPENVEGVDEHVVMMVAVAADVVVVVVVVRDSRREEEVGHDDTAGCDSGGKVGVEGIHRVLQHGVGNRHYCHNHRYNQLGDDATVAAAAAAVVVVGGAHDDDDGERADPL